MPLIVGILLITSVLGLFTDCTGGCEILMSYDFHVYFDASGIFSDVSAAVV